MVAQLPLEALDDAVECMLDVGTFRVRPEGLPRDAERGLETAVTLRAMALGDHLDLDALDATFQPLESPELVEREIVEPCVDRDAAGLHDQIHAAPPSGRAPRSGCPERRKALVWLTWSLTPHSPAEGFTAHRAA